jgi:hypothetical protein
MNSTFGKVFQVQENRRIQSAWNIVSMMLRLCIDIPAMLGVHLAIDHQEHFNRESVARWPWIEPVNTAIWRLSLIYCVSFLFVFFIRCSLSYSFLLSQKHLSFHFTLSSLRFVPCRTSRKTLVFCGGVLSAPSPLVGSLRIANRVIGLWSRRNENSSVVTATGYGLAGWGSISARGGIFSLFHSV